MKRHRVLIRFNARYVVCRICLGQIAQHLLNARITHVAGISMSLAGRWINIPN